MSPLRYAVAFVHGNQTNVGVRATTAMVHARQSVQKSTAYQFFGSNVDKTIRSIQCPLFHHGIGLGRPQECGDINSTTAIQFCHLCKNFDRRKISVMKRYYSVPIEIIIVRKDILFAHIFCVMATKDPNNGINITHDLPSKKSMGKQQLPLDSNREEAAGNTNFSRP